MDAARTALMYFAWAWVVSLVVAAAFRLLWHVLDRRQGIEEPEAPAAAAVPVPAATAMAAAPAPAPAVAAVTRRERTTTGA